MENSSRLFSILYSDLQYLGAIKTPDLEFWVPGSHQNSRSRVLGTWEPSKLQIRSFGYLGAIKTPDPELGYLGVTKTQDLEFGYPGATKSTVISKFSSFGYLGAIKNSGSGVLGTWEPSKLQIQS